MSKSAVMVFSKDALNGCWKWGEHSLPKVSSYSYLITKTKSCPHECLNKRKVADFRPASAGWDGCHDGGCIALLYVNRRALEKE